MKDKDKKYATFFDMATWVRDSHLTKGSAQALLYTFVTRCDPKKDYSCFPTLDTLCADTGLDQKTVKRCADQLIKADLIKKAARFNSSNIWYVNVAKLQEAAERNRANKDAEKAAAEGCPFAPPILKSEFVDDRILPPITAAEQAVVDDLDIKPAHKDPRPTAVEDKYAEACDISIFLHGKFMDHKAWRDPGGYKMSVACARRCIDLLGPNYSCLDAFKWIFDDEGVCAATAKSENLKRYVEVVFKTKIDEYKAAADQDNQDRVDQHAAQILNPTSPMM
jgi:DNA-binding MarR family transcriptional regulator